MPITKVPRPDRARWLEQRRSYIGGSDAAAVVGLNPYVSPYSLWCEKKGITPDFAGNLATDVGEYLEEFIAKRFEQETGKKVRRNNFMIYNSDYPWAMADIDREVVGEDAGLECKSTSALNMKQYKGGSYPAKFYVQCVHYLAVTGKQRWYLAVLIGNSDFKTFCIERKDVQEDIDALMEQEKAFHQQMQGDTPPDMDGTEATDKAVKAQTEAAQDIDMETVADMSDKEDLLDRYFLLKAQMDAAQLEMDAIKQQFMKGMEHYANARTQHYKLTYKPQDRRTFDWKRLQKTYADIDIEPFFKVSRSRSMKIEPITEETTEI